MKSQFCLSDLAHVEEHDEIAVVFCSSDSHSENTLKSRIFLDLASRDNQCNPRTINSSC